ncbi:DUF3348 family protein [Frateuria soli]|uniref:DUF3348 family protein n=1 Tax=Frateuria soli TaxID=1542730 RepID=UPI001E42F0F3|nr:DUF3348 family protein [Frateuria soli]UGB36836.1 DUF3348 domain-containing protein [Frateuria soli]
MAQAVPRPTVRGPTFIRLLARLADADLAAPGQSLPDRLGQWLDWKQALSLADALDGKASAAAFTTAPPDDLHTECARTREALATAIKDDPLPASGPSADSEPDYAAFRQACLARQRAMQANVGRLRGKLRDALMAASTELARLAEVDAVMEAALTPREHALLARVPDLLSQRFERLRAAGSASPSWLDGFRRDMQSVLLAELDLRFQPVDALLAALRTP